MRPRSPGWRTSDASSFIRTRCARRTSIIPTSCESTSTRSRASSGRSSKPSPAKFAQVLDDFGLVGWPKTSGSRGIHVNVRIHARWWFEQVRRAALALAREVERRAPDLRDQQVVEGGAPWRVPRLQPEREGPDGRRRLLGAPEARCARLRSRDLGGALRVRARRVHAAHDAGSLRRRRRPACRHRPERLLARRRARAVGAARSRRARRRAVASALRQAGRRAAARPALAKEERGDAPGSARAHQAADRDRTRRQEEGRARPGSSAGRRVTRRSRRTCSRPMSSSTPCAGAPRLGRACA